MINFNELALSMENDHEMIQAIFEAYQEEYGDGSDKLLMLYQTENWPELFIFSHSLKGVLASFSEDTAVHFLAMIEESTRDNVAPKATDISLTSKELLMINAQIANYLKEFVS